MILEFMVILKSNWKKSPTFRNISLVYGGDALSKIMTVGTTLLLIRGMSISDYASYIAFTSIAVMSASLVGGGINNALIRFSAEIHSKRGDKPYGLNLLSLFVQVSIFLFISIIVFFFPTQTAKLVLGNPDYASLVVISMFYGMGTILINAGRSILQAEEKFSHFVFILWIMNGATLLVVSVFWLLDALLFSLIAWSLAIIHIIVGISIIFFVFKGIDTQMSKKFIDNMKPDKDLLREFFSATGWLIAYSVVLALMSRMSVLMLSHFASNEDLANYGVGFQYYSLGILMLGSIQAVLRPKFSKIDMQSESNQRKFLVKWLKFSFWICIPLFIFILVGKAPFVLVNGIQYEQAFIVLSILSVGIWLSIMLSPLVNILWSRKEFKFLFFISIFAFIVNLVANYIGVVSWGAAGAAVAVVVTHNIALQMPILWKVSK
jgi:O-antigen/teichoic acid export membrane protein